MSEMATLPGKAGSQARALRDCVAGEWRAARGGDYLDRQSTGPTLATHEM
jgi:hypothetical protein